MKSVNISSEIGKLKTVIVHEPGKEVELLTPNEADKEHFIDIVHYEGAIEAHKNLQKVLSLVAENVYKIEDLLLETIKDKDVKKFLINKVTSLSNCIHIKEELKSYSDKDLCDIMIKGLKASPATLTDYLVNKTYTIPPLPNLFFVRDIAMAYTNKIIFGSMTIPSRIREATIISSILTSNFGVSDILNQIDSSMNQFRIEGGDFHVLNPDLLCIGLSERTNSHAVDAIINSIYSTRSKTGNLKPFSVIAIMLPRATTTIHLDMVFSQISINECVVHPPVIIKPWVNNVIEIKINSEGKKQFIEHDSLITAIESCNINLKPISCGGSNQIHQQREQWSSGCNFFAFAPGKALGYDMNLYTLEELSKNGYEIKKAEDIINKPSLINSCKKLIVTISGSELARGSGGCRCMTLPIEREGVQL